jgi:hypothetical protein
VSAEVPSPDDFDAVVFAVPHREYRELDLAAWLGTARPVIFDGFSVLTAEQRALVASIGCATASIGRGESVATPHRTEDHRTEDHRTEDKESE